MNSRNSERRAGLNIPRGFTLIELMVVVAIVAILAGIAHASYTTHIVKTRRAAAGSCALEVAQFMERYYTTKLTYVGAALPDTQCRKDLADHYTLGIDGVDAASYTVKATPKGAQLDRDKRCGTLSIDEAGVKAKTGTATSVSECW